MSMFCYQKHTLYWYVPTIEHLKTYLYHFAKLYCEVY